MFIFISQLLGLLAYEAGLVECAGSYTEIQTTALYCLTAHLEQLETHQEVQRRSTELL